MHAKLNHEIKIKLFKKIVEITYITGISNSFVFSEHMFFREYDSILFSIKFDRAFLNIDIWNTVWKLCFVVKKMIKTYRHQLNEYQHPIFNLVGTLYLVITDRQTQT